MDCVFDICHNVDRFVGDTIALEYNQCKSLCSKFSMSGYTVSINFPNFGLFNLDDTHPEKCHNFCWNSEREKFRSKSQSTGMS